MHELELAISAIEPMLVFSDSSLQSAPRIVDSTDLVENGQRQFSFYISRAADLRKVSTHEVKAQSHWKITESTSPVIEVLLSGFDGTMLRLGRFYYNDSYYDGRGRTQIKSAEFSAWAKKAFSKTRRLLKFDKNLYAYVGVEASEMSKNGIKFSPF